MIDLAAWSFLFESQTYKFQVSYQAERLASRLEKAILPLLCESEVKYTQERLYSELLDIFTSTLCLKATLLTSPYQYMAILFPYKAEFQQEWMQAETNAGNPIIHALEDIAHVRICVSPAIFAYHAGDSLPKCKFDVTTTINDRQGLHCLTRAVVIT